MINLIPPQAKKGVVREYWTRVVSVWFYSWAAALLGGVLIMLPAYVLIKSQVSVYEESAKNASEKVANFEDVSKGLTNSNQQADKLLSGFKQSQVSQRLQTLRSLEVNGIVLSEIFVSRIDEAYEPIKLTGSAEDRQALATFRDRLLALPDVASVDLPISNLAKDRDIQFSLTVVIKKNTP
jgi:uncharacterized SAM-dependent methyltransferase